MLLILEMIYIKFNKQILLILPVIAGIIWGFGGVFTRLLNAGGLDNISILASVVSAAILVLFCILFVFNRDALKIKLKDLWLFVGTGVLGSFVLNFCCNEATFRLPLSLSSLLLGLAPVFALALSAVLFKEKITYKKLACLIISLFGCLLVSGLLESSNGFTFSILGILFGLCAAFFRAIYGIFSKFASERGYQSITIIFYTFLLLMVCTVPFANWHVIGSYVMSNPGQSLLVIFGDALLTSLVPYYLFSVGLKYMAPGKASILSSSTQPISATFFGAILYFEIPSTLNIIGIIISLVGLALLVYFGIKEDEENLKEDSEVTQIDYSSDDVQEGGFEINQNEYCSDSKDTVDDNKESFFLFKYCVAIKTSIVDHVKKMCFKLL